MDKNTIIAFILIGLIILLWPVYMKKIVGVKEPVKKQTYESEDIKSDRETELPSQSFIDRSDEEIIDVSSKVELSYLDKEERLDTLETDIFKGILSSLGGGNIINWQLKEYNAGDFDSGRDQNWVNIVPDSARGNLGISMRFWGKGELDLSKTIFDVIMDTSWIEDGKHFHMIKYSQDIEGGGRVEKEFIAMDGRYDIDVKVRFLSLQNTNIQEEYTIQWASGLSPTEKNIKDDNHYYQTYALQGDEILKTKIGSTGLKEGITNWVAVRTKYFVVALIPRKTLGSAAELKGEKIKITDEEKNVYEWKKYNLRMTMPLEEKSEFKLYLGPMDYSKLKSFGVKLEKMMNFGMVIIRPFSIAFFYTLQFLEGIFRNYGWSIIIFSILIKIILYPLTKKSYKSMRAMQELQPKIMALKEKYKKDPQKMNAETMKLYKQHGVNPMGGCLPMILQMPVLFALFNLFRTTIMLRQASFLGLIKDLSAPDKMISIGDSSFNVLPILMGATMIIQQKLATQDPKQKAMAYFMPIFLLFIFYKLSAGLNLYYLMFNILTIAQELIVKKHK